MPRERSPDQTQTEQAPTAAPSSPVALLLDRAGEELAKPLELTGTCQAAVGLVIAELAQVCAIDLVDDCGRLERAASALGSLTPAESHAAELVLASPNIEHLARQALDAGGGGASSGTSGDMVAAQITARKAPFSVLSVPLVARNRRLGVLTIGWMTPQRRYTAADISLMDRFVGCCALAIDNASRYTRAQAKIRSMDLLLKIGAHEFASALARARAHADVLLLAYGRGQLDEQLFERSLHGIDRAVARLGAISRDLQEVPTSPEALTMRPVFLELERLVQDTVERYQVALPAGHSVNLNVGEGRHVVRADAARIEQVLENVLDNAIKYSPRGGVVRMSTRRDREGVLLEVRDEGLGVSPEGLGAIFEPFARAPEAQRLDAPGSGLGLYISRTIVEQHAGRLWATSPGEGLGTTISLWLPLARPARARVAAVHTRNLTTQLHRVDDAQL